MKIGVSDERGEKISSLIKRRDGLEKKLQAEKERGGSEERIKKILFDITAMQKGIKRLFRDEYAYF